MKKSMGILLMLVLVLSTLWIPVYASTNTSNVSKDDYDIIAPLKNAETLSLKELDKHLITMGFTEDELENLPYEQKVDIAKSGGQKVETSILEVNIVHVDEKGNKSQLILPSSEYYDDGKLRVFSTIMRMGYVNNDRELQYNFYANFRWLDTPVFAWTDTIAMSWQQSTVPYGIPESFAERIPYCCPHLKHDLDIWTNQVEVDGTSWQYDVSTGGSGDEQWGWGKQTVRVPSSLKGHTGSFAVAYAHRYLPGGIDASFSWGNIRFSGVSQKEVYIRSNISW